MRSYRPLGYDLTIACAKFQGNWFIIDGEINEKDALQPGRHLSKHETGVKKKENL